MKKILITGAYGQLGRSLKELAKDFPGLSFLWTDKDTLDITDRQAIISLFDAEQPDYCINAAAYTAVDRAESEPEPAKLLNVDAAGYLAEACKIHNAQMIHFSTDYVYDDYNRPLLETDKTNPRGIYASTKLQGDEKVLSILPDACIIRTSWLYSPFPPNFVETMLRLGKERDRLSVVFDQVGTPTYAPDLAVALLTIINDKKLAASLKGIFHFSNEGVTSWYDFAKAIFEISGIDCNVAPITSDQYPTAARRPKYSVLDKGKFKTVFGLDIPHWREGIYRVLKH